MASGRNPGNLEQMSALVSSVNEANLYVSPAAALVLDNPDELDKNIALLKKMKVRNFFVSSPGKDIYGTLWNINKPVRDFSDKQGLNRLLSASPESALIIDGIYCNQDEEYLDIKFLENL
jgi:uridine kinase